MTVKTESQATSSAGAADAVVKSAADSTLFLRILLIVGIGFFVQTIVTDRGGLATLPIKLLLKNHLHLSTTAVSGFTAITGFAWYIKPLFGVVADTVTVRGTRYRNYLLLASLGAAVAWLLMGIVPQQWTPLLATWTVGNVLLAIISTVLGGYMVTEGRRFGATGRLGAFRNTAMYATGIIAGPLGGWLAAQAFGLTAGICAGMLALLFVYLLFSFREPPAPALSGERASGLAVLASKLKTQYRPLVRSKPFWIAAAMTFFVMCVPGFGTPFLYYQTDTLHFSSEFLGTIQAVQGVMQVIAGFVYMGLCRKFTLRTMLGLGILVNAISTGLYLLYNPQPTMTATQAVALSIDSLNGLLVMIPIIALLDLAARATPTGGESLAYSVLMAVYNFGGQMSDLGGSWLHDHFQLSIHELIVISTLTTVVTFIAVPFLPKALVGTPDGAAVSNAGEVTGTETPDV